MNLNDFFNNFDYFDYGVMMIEKKKSKKLFYAPPKNDEKWMVSIRFPMDIRNKLKTQSAKDYSGRGKQSVLIEDAVRYYLYTASDIKWGEYEKDPDYSELIDDIYEGINQKPLGGATQVFFSNDIKEKILDIEKKIKLTNPLIKDVRTGLIRKAVSIRLTLGDKTFFDAVMGMDNC